MKKLNVKIGGLAIVLAMSCQIASAQHLPSPSLSTKVKAEAFSKSQVEPLSTFMTDFMGPRLAGSQMKFRAEKLVVDKLKEMGFSNVRIEVALDNFTKGSWDNEKNYVAMTAPYYCSFAANPKAWSGSTKGLVKAEAVLVDISSEKDFEQYKGKLAGKIILMPSTQTYEMKFEPLATRYTEEELAALAIDSRVSSGARRNPRPPMDMAAYNFQRRLPELLKNEGVVAIISGGGTFNVPSSRGANYKQGDPEPLPEIILPLEDHGRMCRLVKMGEKVEMELEIRNKFTESKVINNVIAEIPGTDPKLKDEIVLIGAHFDSWHGSTGAADNASGCIVMMEAMRIIKALGISPRRTIRLALWGGEEQGLYGSRGYSQSYLYDAEKNKKLAGYDKFALYLNMDNGSGRFRGIYLEQTDAAVPFMETWMEPLKSLGFNTLTLRTTGGTDHMSFTRLGLPAYQFIQDELEYDRTYHTVMDTYERLSLSDLKTDAAIVAWLVLCAAQDDDRIPAKEGYPQPQPQRPPMM